ncbi:MAG: AAA family ATPase [Lachnospiraceae bacterium]|nr:AAA family ATPase [Lachnospiraceae bacterium]
MDTSERLQKLLFDTVDTAKKWRHEFVTPEHFLYVLTKDEVFSECYELCGGDTEELRKKIKKFFKKNYEQVPEEQEDYGANLSRGFEAMLERGALQADSSGKDVLELPHVFFGMMQLPECYATYLLSEQNVNINDVFFELCYVENDEGDFSGIAPDKFDTYMEEEYEESEEEDYDEGLSFYEGELEEGSGSSSRRNSSGRQGWKKYVTCLNDVVEQEDYTPLIGREEELNRTMLILCRKSKNNPLHIGEPGVGKTAITYGLVRRIVEDNVPDSLKDAKVYAVDMGSMVAGTQYRGDFEKRMKLVLQGIAAEEKPIVYLDEIHNVIGAGAVSGGSLDASNILKPYLANGHIRFIGATTYDEYKKHFEQSKSMVRRFQNVDIKEPSKEETLGILKGLRPYYEEFHEVVYPDEVLQYAVSLSGKYINERFWPDKAIDLMDEAGAMMNLDDSFGEDSGAVLTNRVVTKELLEEVLAKLCKIPKQSVASDEAEQLKTLEQRLRSRVFGQEEAVQQVCRCIRMSRAGLNEENKPVASFLFVGPTGVGKTEIARALADSLGVELVRFDMSEYMEKHAVAKFIGAPAGYVGYEEGGMLTDAIRKKPHCVLLLDEVEKAHPDIFNVLLQVMDYATLRDNQGRKADFRNVILIMTSNAGATRLGKPVIGFGEGGMNTGAIEEEVKRIFSPEFRNRLSGTVVFHELNKDMAERIVEKQLGLLADHLKKRRVNITFSRELKNYIAQKGMSREYGARQIQRVIDEQVKPALVEQLLFGELAEGGNCQVGYEGEKVTCQAVKESKAE